MLRTILAILLALGVGVVGGAAAIRTQMQGALASVQLENVQLQREAEQLRTREAAATDTLARVKGEAARNLEAIAQLQKDLDALRLAAVAPPPVDAAEAEEAPDLAALLNLDEPLPRSVLESPETVEEADEDRRRQPWGENMTEEQRQAWETQRAEWRQRAREGVLNLYEDAAVQSRDPVEQERLRAIAQYSDAMFEFRNQLRDAATDEERDALREQMGQNAVEMRSLMREQQDHMLGQLAQQYGVDNPRQQRQFADALRETMQSPLYNMGGRGRWGGGGFGGGGFNRRGGD